MGKMEIQNVSNAYTKASSSCFTSSSSSPSSPVHDLLLDQFSVSTDLSIFTIKDWLQILTILVDVVTQSSVPFQQYIENRSVETKEEIERLLRQMKYIKEQRDRYWKESDMKNKNKNRNKNNKTKKEEEEDDDDEKNQKNQKNLTLNDLNNLDNLKKKKNIPLSLGLLSSSSSSSCSSSLSLAEYKHDRRKGTDKIDRIDGIEIDYIHDVKMLEAFSNFGDLSEKQVIESLIVDGERDTDGDRNPSKERKEKDEEEKEKEKENENENEKEQEQEKENEKGKGKGKGKKKKKKKKKK